MNETLHYQPPAPRLKHSRAGIASMLLGTLSLAVLVLSLGVSVTPGGGTAGTSPDLSPVGAWAIMLTYLAIPVLGLALGIVGLRSNQRKHITAIVGVCLNGLILVLIALILMLFL